MDKRPLDDAISLFETLSIRITNNSEKQEIFNRRIEDRMNELEKENIKVYAEIDKQGVNIDSISIKLDAILKSFDAKKIDYRHWFQVGVTVFFATLTLTLGIINYLRG